MNHKNLAILLIVVIALLGGTVAYLFFTKKVEAPVQTATPQKTPPNLTDQPAPPIGTDQTAPQTNPSAPKPSVKQDGAVYTNTDYGFKFTLPKGWENYKVAIRKNDMQKEASYIYIALPTSDKSYPGVYVSDKEILKGYSSLFNIGVWDKALWDKEIKSEDCKTPHPGCPFESMVIAKSDKYVFDSGFPNGMQPKDLMDKEQIVQKGGIDFFKQNFELVK